MRLNKFLTLATLLLGAVATASAEPMRGVWVATPEHTRFFDSPTEMARQLDAFKRIGINTVFAAMWNQGRTMFPSETARALTGAPIRESMGTRDPLAELIPLAHARGIKVYAWFEFGFVADYQGGPGREILQKHPDWAALDRDGKPVVKNGFRWMDALNPEVQRFVRELILEAARRYDIDGIQGDDRLPAMASEGGYNPATVAEYEKAFGRPPPRDPREPQWLAWRADKLTQFMQRLHDELKAARPQLQISLSPSPFPWGYDEYLQDWPRWLKLGLMDSVSPQLYRYDIAGYRAELRKLAREQVADPAQRARVFPGVLLALGNGYVAPAALLRQMVEENRREHIAGEVYFHSEGLAPRAAVIEQLYKDRQGDPQ